MKDQIPAIHAKLNELSALLDYSSPNVAMILAAGHGKRIKSEKSKMLHMIWGVPTVTRVANAAREGLETTNQILVVGIKALDVASAVGKAPQRAFMFQEQQKGTGDAVRVGLRDLLQHNYSGAVYVFPGDMGLLNSRAIRDLRRDFESVACDMMVLTADYQGNPEENYYGRIVRVPEKDATGKSSGADHGKVIEIIEHRDLLALEANKPYRITFNRR